MRAHGWCHAEMSGVAVGSHLIRFALFVDESGRIESRDARSLLAADWTIEGEVLLQETVDVVLDRGLKGAERAAAAERGRQECAQVSLQARPTQFFCGRVVDVFAFVILYVRSVVSCIGRLHRR